MTFVNVMALGTVIIQILSLLFLLRSQKRIHTLVNSQHDELVTNTNTLRRIIGGSNESMPEGPLNPPAT